MKLSPGVPVLAREQGHVQVGAARPVAFAGLSPEARQFLESLEGRARAVSPRERAEFAPLIAELDRAGLLVSTGAGPQHARSAGKPEDHAVRFSDTGAVAAAAALALARSGINRLGFGAAGTSDARAHSVMRELAGSAPGVRSLGAHELAHVEILTGHTDAFVTAARDAMAHDTPHITVGLDELGVTVAATVPGETACTLCDALTRIDTDPWWPRVAIQLGARAHLRDVDAVVATAAGAAVAQLALDLIAGSTPARTLWRWVPGRAHATQSERVPHPACGCGAT